MLVWAYDQKVSRLKNVAEKLKIRYGKNKTISVRVKGRLDPIFFKSARVRWRTNHMYSDFHLSDDFTTPSNLTNSF